MTWFKEPLITKPLKDYPDIKITYRNPAGWPAKKYFKLRMKILRMFTGDTDTDDLNKQLDLVETEREKFIELAVSLIKEWNMTDPYSDSNKILPIKEEVLNELPEVILSEILGHVNDLIINTERATTDPKSDTQSKNSQKESRSV